MATTTPPTSPVGGAGTLSPQSASTFEEATYRKMTWRLVPFLLPCYVVTYLDRVNVDLAKLQVLDDPKFSKTVYGFDADIFFIGYPLFEAPSNVILHHAGARIWIARIMISWGIISAVMMFVITPAMFYVMRSLLGLAEADFFPGIILYLTYWYSTQRCGRTTTFFMTAIALSGVIDGPISGWTMKASVDVYGLAGRQWMSPIEGIPSIIVGITVLAYLDDRISHAKWLTDEERALSARNIAAEDTEREDSPIRTVMASPRVWLMSLIYLTFMMGLYGVSFWLPTLIKQTGVTDPFSVGLLTAIPYGTAVVAMVLVARSADRLRERRWHVAILAVVGAIGLVLSAVWHTDTILVMAALTLGTMGILTTLPLFWGLPITFLAGTGAAAGIVLINSLDNLVGFLSPYTAGWLKDATQSTDSDICMLATSMVLGAILMLSVPARMVNR